MLSSSPTFRSRLLRARLPVKFWTAIHMNELCLIGSLLDRSEQGCHVEGDRSSGMQVEGRGVLLLSGSYQSWRVWMRIRSLQLRLSPVRPEYACGRLLPLALYQNTIPRNDLWNPGQLGRGSQVQSVSSTGLHRCDRCASTP